MLGFDFQPPPTQPPPIRILKWQGTKRSPFIHAVLYQPFPRIEWSQWALSCQLTLCGILACLVCPSERPIEQDRNPESNIGIWFDLTSNLNLKSNLLHLMYTFFLLELEPVFLICSPNAIILLNFKWHLTSLSQDLSDGVYNLIKILCVQVKFLNFWWHAFIKASILCAIIQFQREGFC